MFKPSTIKEFLYVPLVLVIVLSFVFGPLAPLAGFPAFMPQIAEANTPIEIASCHALYAALTDGGGLENDYLLTSDLDCTDDGLEAEALLLDDDAPEPPLTSDDFLFGGFSGTLDGGGNTMTLGYALNNDDALFGVGLFAGIYGGTIENLVVDITIDVALTDTGMTLLMGGLAGDGFDLEIRDVSGSVAITFTGSEIPTSVGSVGGLVGSCDFSCAFSDIDLSANVRYLGPETGGENIGGLVGVIWDGHDGDPSLLSLENVAVAANIHAPYMDGVGGAVGSASGLVHMEGVSVTPRGGTGTVVGHSYVGGVVGSLNGDGELSESSATIAVEGSDYVGGFAGLIIGSSISTSYATGAVSGSFFAIGGFVGGNSGEVTESYATGNVTADANGVGGFVGVNESVIENAYARGSVLSDSYYVGGFAGANYGQIFYGYSTGDVETTGESAYGIGGFVGDNGADTIYSSFSVGTVTAPDAEDVGGFIGADALSHHNSGWWVGAHGGGPAIGALYEGGEDQGPVQNIAWNREHKSDFFSAALGLYTTSSDDDPEFSAWSESVWEWHTNNYPTFLWQMFEEDVTEDEEEEQQPPPRRRSAGGGGIVFCSATRTTFCNPGQNPANSQQATLAELQAQLNALIAQLAALGGTMPAGSSMTVSGNVRDLEFGMQGEDVRALQTLLIAQGHQIPAGATGFFGPQTQAALAAYQQANGIMPASGYFGPITRAQMKAAGLEGLWW